MTHITQNNNFLTQQIITYLGNKRKLIPFLDSTIQDIIENDPLLLDKEQKKTLTFFDIFSGSGVVSRYGKVKNFIVYNNDLENYSYIINTALMTEPNEVNNIFDNVAKLIGKEHFGDPYQRVLDYLNSLRKPKLKQNFYYSKHYSPKDTANPDFHNERLFYTQENALKIDAILEVIFNNDIFNEKARNIILASLMYNMSKHINTSGTMKGFHNGWGGPTKSSLNRILAPIKLEKLPFINGNKCFSYQDYAERVFDNNNIDEVDIIYADPPYNQHQYSSNYGLLITACNNDKYNPGPVVRGSRAGIRKDHNKSNFCKRSLVENEKISFAEKAFIDFFKSIKTKYLILSYNNEGILNINKLIDILSNNKQNKISIKYQLHSKFKGGRIKKDSTNVIEYLIVVEFNKKQDEIDYKTLLEEIHYFTEQKLFLYKYIDYPKLSQEAESLSSWKYINENENYFFLKSQTEHIFLKVNKKTYRVDSEMSSGLTLNDIEIIKKYILNYEELINIYINQKQKKLAESILTCFNGKKYEQQRKHYTNLINNI